jgi:hypothetical protein
MIVNQSLRETRHERRFRTNDSGNSPVNLRCERRLTTSAEGLVHAIIHVLRTARNFAPQNMHGRELLLSEQCTDLWPPSDVRQIARFGAPGTAASVQAVGAAHRDERASDVVASAAEVRRYDGHRKTHE